MLSARFRGALALAMLSCVLRAQDAKPILDRISAQSMRGHVSFLASDLLQGRATPSPGLNVAAEYIAAQFRRAGLEPAGDDGYFQTAKFATYEPVTSGAVLELTSAGRKIAQDPAQAAFTLTSAISLNAAPVLCFNASDLDKVKALKHDDVAGKVLALFVEHSFFQDRQAYRTYSAARALKPALLIIAGPGTPRQRRARMVGLDEAAAEIPVVAIRDGDFAKAIQSGGTGLTITASFPAPKEQPATLRNVAAILRGSDPALRDTYILVTAHYDHIGVKAEGIGDLIYNGANDDASGTASVMEIAGALAAMNPRPKRSIVFIALFGEEEGLLGSQYYGRHPLFPLDKSIGDVNLEQLGRTDASDGPKIASATFTGFGFSDIPTSFRKAGEETGVTVYKDEKRSDPFFARSDNQALADLGVPAHTICVAFEFPDYHAVGDEWQKLDYENMAKVDRMVALGLIHLANSTTTPQWTTETDTKKYTDAWKSMHPVAGTQ